MNIPWLTADTESFPPTRQALDEPNGLLAAGGDLSPQRLLAAYEKGIFPWYDDQQPILWWSPNPRTILKPADIHISKSLKKALRKSTRHYSFNQAFEQVISLCADLREYDQGTWITEEMMNAYRQLHDQGHAHSIEVWCDHELVGGLYGVAVGDLFCGESMFHQKTDASKMAFVALCKWLAIRKCRLVDCQILNPHLESLGVKTISRKVFKSYLASPDPSSLENANSLPKTNCALPNQSAELDQKNQWHSLPWASTKELAQAIQ